MIRRFSLTLLATLAGLLWHTFAFPQQAAQMTARDLYKMASPSVVLIETYGEDNKVNGNGSGFLVGPTGEIFTNFHVIAHTKRATVRLANDDAYDEVGVLDVDKRKDIALIKIKAVGLPYLKLGRSSPAQVGDKLYALGNPLGVFQNTLSEGILSGIRQMDGYKLFQLSTPISHGSSGSPVFNQAGEVIGIIEATLSEGQNLNFAIPIDYASGMIESKNLSTLASIYTPEEKPQSAPPQIQPTSASSPSESLRRDSFTYLSSKLGVWTKEDAELELGQPIDRRDSILNNSVTGDIYKYKGAGDAFGTIELNVSRESKKVIAAYFYYSGIVSWNSVRGKLGKNYKKQKLPNGRPGYLYQFQNRQVFIIVDSAENVVSIGTW